MRVLAQSAPESPTSLQVKGVLDTYEKLLAKGQIVPYVHGSATAQGVVAAVSNTIWPGSALNPAGFEYKLVRLTMQEWYLYTGAGARTPSVMPTTQEQSTGGIPTWALALGVGLVAYFLFVK